MPSSETQRRTCGGESEEEWGEVWGVGMAGEPASDAAGMRRGEAQGQGGAAGKGKRR